MRKFVVVGAAVAVCALLIGGAYVKYGNDGEVKAEQAAEQGSAVEQASVTSGERFAKWGNIVNIENTTAGLVYEEPGKPALKVDLVFTMATICIMNGKEATCPIFADSPFFAQGARVYVEGVKEGNIVTVTKIGEQAAE